MPAAKQEERIPISSASALSDYFSGISTSLAEVETEDSWQRLDKALAKLEAITKGGGYKFDEYIGYMKSIAQPICNSLLSERTKLSGTAIDLMNSVAPRLADRFEALVPIFVPSLLTVCARTNKVALGRAKKTLLLIAKHCRLASLLPLLREASKDKVPTLRVAAVETASVLVECIDLARANKRVTDVETIVKGCATDSNPEVRQLSKRLFSAYVDRWPERVEQFTVSFTPTIRRYLALPKTGAYKPAAAEPVAAPRDAPMREAELMSSSRAAKPAQPAPESQLMTQLSAMRAAPRAPAPSSSLFGGAMGAPAPFNVAAPPRRAPTLDVLARSTSTFSLSHGATAPVSAPMLKSTFSTSSTLASSSSSVLSAYAAQIRPALALTVSDTRVREKSRGRERKEGHEHVVRPERQRTVSHSEVIPPAAVDVRPKLATASLSSSVIEHQLSSSHTTAPSERVAEQLFQLTNEHHQRTRETSRDGQVTPPVSSDSATLEDEATVAPLTAPATSRTTTRVKASRVAVVMPPSTVKRQPQPSASRVLRTLPKSSAALGLVTDEEEQGTPTAAPSRNGPRAIKDVAMLAPAEPEPPVEDEAPKVPAQSGQVEPAEVAVVQEQAEPRMVEAAETKSELPKNGTELEAHMEEAIAEETKAEERRIEPFQTTETPTEALTESIAASVAPVAAPVASTGPSAKIAAALRPITKVATSASALKTTDAPVKAPVKPAVGLGGATAPRRPAPLVTAAAAAKARAVSTSSVGIAAAAKAAVVSKPSVATMAKVAGPSANIAARAGKPIVGRSVSATVPSIAKVPVVRAPLAAPRAPAAPVRPAVSSTKAIASSNANKLSSTTVAPKPRAPAAKPVSGPAARPAAPRVALGSQPAKPAARPAAAAKSAPTVAPARKVAPVAGPSARLTKILADRKAASKSTGPAKKPADAVVSPSTEAVEGLKPSTSASSNLSAASTGTTIFLSSPVATPAAPPGSPMPLAAAAPLVPETPQPQRVENLRVQLTQLLGEAPLSAHAPKACVPPLEPVREDGGEEEEETRAQPVHEALELVEPEQQVEAEQPAMLQAFDVELTVEDAQLPEAQGVDADAQVPHAEIVDVQVQISAAETEKLQREQAEETIEPEMEAEEQDVAQVALPIEELAQDDVELAEQVPEEATQAELRGEEAQDEISEAADLEPDEAAADPVELETDMDERQEKAELPAEEEEEDMTSTEVIQEEAATQPDAAEAHEDSEGLVEEGQQDVEHSRPSTLVASAPITAVALPPRSAARSARATPSRTPLLLSSSNGVPLSARTSPAPSALKYKTVAYSPLKVEVAASPRASRKPLTRAAAAAAQVVQPELETLEDSYDESNLYDSDALPDDSVEMVRFSAPSRTMATTSPLKIQRTAASTLRPARGDASADTVIGGSDDDDEADDELRINHVDGRLQLVCGAGADDHPYSDTLPPSEF